MAITHSVVKAPGETVRAVLDWNASHSGTAAPDNHGNEAHNPDMAEKATYDAHDHSAADPTQVSHADLSNVTSDQHHARSHTIISTSDHTSAATSGKILKADANGLPVDATNTDAQVSAAYTHSQNNSQAHSDYMLNTGDTATGNYTFDTPTFHIDSTNHRVGIGTTGPVSQLQVSGTVTFGVAALTDGILNTPSAMYFNIDSNNDETIQFFSWAKDRATSSGGTELMRLTEAGNVGIGTTTPTTGYKLDTNGAIISTGAIAGNYFLDRDSVTKRIWGWYSTGNVAKFTNDASWATFLAIDSTNGNVGIGTTTPHSKLAVVSLPAYANNAAAITGGLAAGDFYRTGGDPDLVCVVH